MRAVRLFYNTVQFPILFSIYFFAILTRKADACAEGTNKNVATTTILFFWGMPTRKDKLLVFDK